MPVPVPNLTAAFWSIPSQAMLLQGGGVVPVSSP